MEALWTDPPASIDSEDDEAKRGADHFDALLALRTCANSTSTSSTARTTRTGFASEAFRRVRSPLPRRARQAPRSPAHARGRRSTSSHPRRRPAAPRPARRDQAQFWSRGPRLGPELGLGAAQCRPVPESWSRRVRSLRVSARRNSVQTPGQSLKAAVGVSPPGVRISPPPLPWCRVAPFRSAAPRSSRRPRIARRARPRRPPDQA